jgi:hypothetical protein
MVEGVETCQLCVVGSDSKIFRVSLS